MLGLSYIKKFFPLGTVLIMENNPKNAALMQYCFKKHRMRTELVESLAEAKEKFQKKEYLGVVLDHQFRRDPEHRGYDFLRFIRRENENLRNFPVYLVASVETADLQEYEYLKIIKYYDTEENLVGPVVEEMVEYFTPRE